MSSDDDTQEQGNLCAGVEMTPVQCNEVIEGKLAMLVPVLKCTLSAFQRVENILQNGKIDWRKALERAKRRVS